MNDCWIDASVLLARLRREIAEAGTAKAIAAQYGVSPQYLGDVLKGRREIGAGLAAKMGYVVVRMFQAKREGMA